MPNGPRRSTKLESRCHGSNAVTVARLMIVLNPSDEALRSADAIALFDPNRPDWHEVVVVAGARPARGQAFVVLDIPVDSTDQSSVRSLRDRIAFARR